MGDIYCQRLSKSHLKGVQKEFGCTLVLLIIKMELKIDIARGMKIFKSEKLL